MPIITITAQAKRAISRAAINAFSSTGAQLPSGDWEIPLEETTLDRLRQAQFTGETISETIIRIASGHGQTKLS